MSAVRLLSLPRPNPRSDMSSPRVNEKSVKQWLVESDLHQIKTWLAGPKVSAALAMDTLLNCLLMGKTDIAQVIFHSGILDQGVALRTCWENITHSVKNRAILTNKTSELDSGDYIKGVNWLVEKSSCPPPDVSPKIANDGLLRGLMLAFFSDNELLWDKIVALRPDAGVATARNVLVEMLSFHSSWRPARNFITPQWSKSKVVLDMLDLGVRPGGTFWVGAAYYPQEDKVFDAILASAKRLTTPRQRTAILMYAHSVSASGFDRLVEAFFPLTVPTHIKLSQAELRKVGPSYADKYLADIGNEHAYHYSTRGSRDIFTAPSMDISDVLGEKWSALIREKLTAVARQARPNLDDKPSRVPRPKI